MPEIISGFLYIVLLLKKLSQKHFPFHFIFVEVFELSALVSIWVCWPWVDFNKCLKLSVQPLEAQSFDSRKIPRVRWLS